MNKKPYILFVAPNAPPKNTPEAIQVRRILVELDKLASGHLVTVNPNVKGTWGQCDASLELKLQHFTTQNLSLPLHNLSSRLLMSHRMAKFQIPDSMMWITWMTGCIQRSLKKQPDIIYSRSSPMSAALLACKLKQRLGVLWVMHLSDPWADNPYKKFDARDAAIEAQCFTKADLITLTTKGQVEHYRKKYPAFANKIMVSPNVMAEEKQSVVTKPKYDNKLHIVYAGTLYGDRSPEPVLKALDILSKTEPKILNQLHIDFYGNAQEKALKLLKNAPSMVHYHGAVSFAEAYTAQNTADVVLNIEAELNDPLSKCFLPSKVIDCLALGKPLLALTPDGSETASLCEEGYGWAVSPSHPQELSRRLIELIRILPQLRERSPKAPPKRYSAKTVADDLISQMHQLLRVHSL